MQGRPPRRAPSQADVARAAGVSGQTVSRVSRGEANVDETTRLRVLTAMRSVGYRPNGAARALRMGRFRTIGVIMFALTTVGNVRTLDAIASAAAGHGYSLTLLPVLNPTQQAVSGAFSRMGEAAVDGVVILIEAHALEEADLQLPEGLPVVVIDSSAGYDYPVVDTDQGQGARLAVEHLLDLGHETVWHVAGPSASYAAERRRASWEQTLQAHDRRVPAPAAGDWAADSGYAAAGRLLAAGEEPTAIFAANDQMALGVLRALWVSGRRVPADVSVVGFDDLADVSQYVPPLTTVHQSFDEVGRRSVTALLREIGGHAHVHALDHVPTRLVVRESTAPPRRWAEPGAGSAP